jgi:heterodisulfide reductase subunit A
MQLFSDSVAGRDFGDVMVVGGGVSGIQASLDLATAGFRVFPTNDCSM